MAQSPGVAKTTLSLTYEVKYAPQPSILRGVRLFEQSLRGTVERMGDKLQLPAVLRDKDGTHQIVIGPESFALTVEPLTRVDRFGPSATSLSSQFVTKTPGIAPREVELRALLAIPVPNLARLLTGLASVTFTTPRKVELRPEAMGKDHYIASETGIAHLRLSTHTLSTGNWIHLLLANRHDRVSSEPEVLDQAFSLCLKGVRAMVASCQSPIYRQALGALVTQSVNLPAGGK